MLDWSYNLLTGEERRVLRRPTRAYATVKLVESGDADMVVLSTRMTLGLQFHAEASNLAGMVAAGAKLPSPDAGIHSDPLAKHSGEMRLIVHSALKGDLRKRLSRD